jgi:hypothetical protein
MKTAGVIALTAAPLALPDDGPEPPPAGKVEVKSGAVGRLAHFAFASGEKGARLTLRFEPKDDHVAWRAGGGGKRK